MNDINHIIKKLGLKPHIEGGYYKETYKSSINMSLKSGAVRQINTAIYYLLESKDFSCWHRLKSDEIWHFHCGSNLTIYQIDNNGDLTRHLLGDPLKSEEALPQQLIPANTWFAVKINDLDSFSLVGCTVSPGFEFEDFEIGNRDDLLLKFPQHKELILQFSRNYEHEYDEKDNN